MHPRVARIQPEQSLAELIRTLARERVSGVPVVEEDCRLVGVVSATDVLEAVAHELIENGSVVESDLAARKVKEIMTPAVLTVTPETTVAETAQLLHKAKLHRALVIEDGRLIGIVTAFDVLLAASQPVSQP
jgi:CBS domain-containing protein